MVALAVLGQRRGSISSAVLCSSSGSKILVICWKILSWIFGSVKWTKMFDELLHEIIERTISIFLALKIKKECLFCSCHIELFFCYRMPMNWNDQAICLLHRTINTCSRTSHHQWQYHLISIDSVFRRYPLVVLFLFCLYVDCSMCLCADSACRDCSSCACKSWLWLLGI